jgi:hypothetical protein
MKEDLTWQFAPTWEGLASELGTGTILSFLLSFPVGEISPLDSFYVKATHLSKNSRNSTSNIGPNELAP